MSHYKSLQATLAQGKYLGSLKLKNICSNASTLFLLHRKLLILLVFEGVWRLVSFHPKIVPSYLVQDLIFFLKQVSVAPGGRWNKFKTYSTIQRTFEIWGFVISFLFKAWLNNQKFMYKGNFFKKGTAFGSNSSCFSI